MLRLCPLKHRSDCVYLSDEHGNKVLRPGPLLCFFPEMKEYCFSLFILLFYYILSVVLLPTTSPLLQILSPDPPPIPHTSPSPPLQQDIQGYQPNTAPQTTIRPEYTITNTHLTIPSFWWSNLVLGKKDFFYPDSAKLICSKSHA